MEILLNLIFSVAFGAICAYIAGQKGRNTTAWFLLGLFFTFISLLILLFLPNAGESKVVPASEGLGDGVAEYELIDVEAVPVSAADWYYLDSERQQHGPVDIRALAVLWENGAVRGDSLVWTDGMGEWVPINSLPELLLEIEKG